MKNKVKISGTSIQSFINSNKNIIKRVPYFQHSRDAAEKATKKINKDAYSPKNVIESIDMGSLAIVIPERKDEDKTSMAQQGLTCPPAVEEVKFVQPNIQ